MKHYLMIAALCLALILPAAQAEALKKPRNQIDISVDGLVCDFCARALEKTFGKREEVESISVDLDAGRVSILIKSGQSIDDATLTQIITDSGYNVVDIGRGQ